MKTNKLIFPLAFASFILLFAACKGRTLENVEPTGETIDVEIDTIHSPARTPVIIVPDTARAEQIISGENINN